MKEKMRVNLEIARKSSTTTAEKSQFSTSKKPEKREELTAEEHLARTKAIEQIEEGSFQPRSFRSGGGNSGKKVSGFEISFYDTQKCLPEFLCILQYQNSEFCGMSNLAV
uniref:Uncharacterized protein n=2 Tax=Caenorhabditis japonica TaxID=281687 RepID=A0A8R1EJ08_CAEJA